MTRLSAATTRILIILALIICIGMPAAVCAAEGDGPAPEVTYTDTGEAVTVTDAPEELGLPSESLQDAGKSRSAFALKRLLVFTDQQLTDSHGAVSLTYYDYAQEYILDYATEEDTEAAYDALVQEYGKDKVIIDFVFQALEAAEDPGEWPEGTETAEESSETPELAGEALAVAEDPNRSAYDVTASLSASWGADMMQLDAARDRADADPDLTDTVTIAVLDSGINAEHELFQGRLTENGASFITDSPYDLDESSHGTHVAGIVADCTPKQVKILPIKILNAKGEGPFSALLNGIDHAVQSGAAVINLSLSVALNASSGSVYDIEELPTEPALKNATEAGCLVITASGNNSKNMDELCVYPAVSPYTITIGSITQSRTRTSSSNYGNGVDFAAPGVGILSAAITGPSDYITKNGTSMAAPHAAAAFGMLRLYNPDASSDALLETMRAVSEDLGDAGKDKQFGYGLPVFAGGIVPDTTTTEPTDPVTTDDPQDASTSEAEKQDAQAAARLAAQRAAAQKAAAQQAAARQAAAQRAYTAKVNRAKAKKVTSFKAKAVKSRKAKLSWKASGVTGYQVKYGLGKKLKKAKTKTLKTKKLTLKKLKAGKTYYVKVRPYTQLKTPGGRTVKIYGKWSKAKKIRAKR